MSGIASNIVLKEEVRDPMLLLLLTDRMWDSSSFKGSDMSQSPLRVSTQRYSQGIGTLRASTAYCAVI